MPSNPKGSCGACRVVKEIATKLNNNLRKHFLKYSIFYLLIMEVSTIYLRNLPNYDLKIFPFLTQLGFATIFYSLWLYRDFLKFCQRKKIAVFSLSIYYAINALTIVFQICNSIYTQIISYLLLGTVFISLLLTIYKNKK